MDSFPVWSDRRLVHRTASKTAVREVAFHMNTRLRDGRNGAILDPGSVGCLIGDRTARLLAMAAAKHGKKPEHKRRERTLNVSGVGTGSQQATHDCQLPIALKDTQGRPHVGLQLPPCTTQTFRVWSVSTRFAGVAR